VTSETLLDAPLLHKYCASLPAAEQQALREAADTGGIVLRVKSLRIEPHRIVLAGLIPATALAFEHPSEFPAYLQPRSIGTLHLTETSLNTNPGDEVGYLVLQTPVAAAGLLPESEDGDSFWVALAVERTFHTTLKPGSIGAVCCARCNRPIPQQRLLAVPNTRVCTHCQQKKEKR
jgi:hypothetical protein